MSQRRFGRTPGGVCTLGLHLLWCPKYRRWVLGGPVAARCGELLEQIAVEHGWEIGAKEVVPDHVHMLVRVGQGNAPVQVLRQEFRYLRGFATLLWSPSYFAASLEVCVGVDRGSLHRTSMGRGGLMRRSYVFRLRPTARQHVALGQCLDAHRELYNAALQERRDAWSHSKTRIFYGDQSAQLRGIRDGCPDQAVWSFSSQQATLRRLNKAFDGFFRRVKTAKPGVKPGYPRFKGKNRFDSIEWPKDGDGARCYPRPSGCICRVWARSKCSCTARWRAGSRRSR